MALKQPAAGDELFDYPWEQFDRVHFFIDGLHALYK